MECQPPHRMYSFLWFLLLRTAPPWDRASSMLTFRDHIHKTFGRTPLDGRSSRRGDLYLYGTQHSRQTPVVPGRIRTRDPSKRAAADSSLRPRCHRDRRFLWLTGKSLTICQFTKCHVTQAFNKKLNSILLVYINRHPAINRNSTP